MKQEFFFYDLETSGLSPREDRIMQFAGIRTDLDFNQIGEPVNILVKVADDTLPSPQAIGVTGITPQSTLQDGFTEAEFCRYVMDEIFTPGTIAVGYNSIRFDDEFMRHIFWRNFFDAYEWQWKDGRSKWDLLDVVRLVRALRPEGIKWPVGKKEIKDKETGEKKEVEFATNRLELITKENGITHTHAHDALSDVEALIDVTRLIKTHQPKMYDYLFENRDKKKVQKIVNLENKKPFVYACGKYSSAFDKTTVAFPIAPGRNGNVLVFDLRYNLDELLEKENNKSAEDLKKESTFFPIVKELAYNKCPAVAPLGVLAVENGWEKIKLDQETVEKNLKSLLAHPEFAEKMRSQYESKPEWPRSIDSESALYDGFLSEPDRVRCNAVRNANKNQLADFHPDFIDERLPELLLHYKAKNFPSALTESEQTEWEKYRIDRLNRQAPAFMKGLEELQKKEADPYIVEELQLWFQSLQGSDF